MNMRTLRGHAALLLILLAFISFAFVPPVQGAKAAENTVAFDYTDVLDDLAGSTDGNGNAFDINNYPKDPKGTAALYSFMEYGYSYAENRRGNYGLYLYIYNPTAAELETSGGLNRAQMATNFDAEGEPSGYDKFELVFCGRTTGDYNHLFYKFKVKNSAFFEQLVDANERRYVISGIELQEKGNREVKEYGVGGIYTFKGFAAGYGADVNAAGSLRCTRADLETVELDVRSTYYRYPTTTTTATQLVSAYFAIDNELIKKYGKLYAILAEWWEYELAPIVVLKDKDLYDLYKPWEGLDLTDESTPDTPAHIMTYGDRYEDNYTIDWYIGKGWGMHFFGSKFNLSAAEAEDKLVNLFTSSGTDAGEYAVTSDALEEHMREYTSSHGQGNAYKGYNDDLFTGGAGYTKIEKTTDDLFDLKGFDLGSSFLNWWYDTFFGYDNEPIEGIDPIYAVQKNDLNSSDIANDLLIDKNDVSAFKAYCNEQMAIGKTVYLFRYGVSDYSEREAISVPTGISGGWEVEYENSVRRETVYLGFDIIQLTFKSEDGTLTVLPVVADPIDVIPDSNGMGSILDDVNGDGKSWLLWLAIGTAVLAVAILVILILRNIFRSKDRGPRKREKQAQK